MQTLAVNPQILKFDPMSSRWNHILFSFFFFIFFFDKRWNQILELGTHSFK